MKAAQVRRLAYETLHNLEWIDQHATTRRHEDGEALAFKIQDMTKALLRLIGAPLREPKPTSGDVEETRRRPTEVPSPQSHP